MALMSILDDRRVFFAASHGISGEPEQQRSDTAEASHCRYVVALDDVLMVNDSLSDDRVKTHPATISGGVRAYLGVPLRVQRLLPRLVLRRPPALTGMDDRRRRRAAHLRRDCDAITRRRQLCAAVLG